MKKALILLLAFVMVVSAGMGFGAAATTSDTTGAQDQTLQKNKITEPVKSTETGNKEKKFREKCDQCDDCKENGCDHCDKCKEEIKDVTVIIIQKKIISYLYYNSAAAAAGAGAGANNAANKGAGKTVPMQKTGLPILPAILSTLMIGSGLLYGRLRN